VGKSRGSLYVWGRARPFVAGIDFALLWINMSSDEEQVVVDDAGVPEEGALKVNRALAEFAEVPPSEENEEKQKIADEEEEQRKALEKAERKARQVEALEKKLAAKKKKEEEKKEAQKTPKFREWTPSEQREIEELFEKYDSGLQIVFKRYSIAQQNKGHQGTFEEIGSHWSRLDFVKFYRLCKDFGIAHRKGLDRMRLKQIFLAVSKKGVDYKFLDFKQLREVLVVCAEEILSKKPFSERYQTLPVRARAVFHRMDLADERRAFLTKRMLGFGGFQGGDGKLGGHAAAPVEAKDSEFSNFDFEQFLHHTGENGEKLHLLQSFRKPGEPRTPPPQQKRAAPKVKKTVPSKVQQSLAKGTIQNHRSKVRPSERNKKSKNEQEIRPDQRDRKELECENDFSVDESAKLEIAKLLGIKPTSGPEEGLELNRGNISTPPPGIYLPEDLLLWSNLQSVDIRYTESTPKARCNIDGNGGQLRPVLSFEKKPKNSKPNEINTRRRNHQLSLAAKERIREHALSPTCPQKQKRPSPRKPSCAPPSKRGQVIRPSRIVTSNKLAARHSKKSMQESRKRQINNFYNLSN